MERSNKAPPLATAAVVVLGLNTYLLTVVLPQLGGSGRGLAVGLVAPLALAAGLWLRSRFILLGLYPAVMIVTALVIEKLITRSFSGELAENLAERAETLDSSVAVVSAQSGLLNLNPIAFWFIPASLVCYWIAAAWYVIPRAHVPEAAKRLTPTSHYGKWQRRKRLTLVLTVLAMALPVFLISVTLFDQHVSDSIYEMYAGRSALMQTLFVVVICLLWLLVYSRVFLRVLLEQRRSRARLAAGIGSLGSGRGLTWLGFRLAAAAALIAVMLYIW